MRCQKGLLRPGHQPFRACLLPRQLFLSRNTGSSHCAGCTYVKLNACVVRNSLSPKSMSLDRRPRSRFILVTITYTGITLFHQVDGFPVVVKAPATVVPSVGSDSLPPPILLSSDTWTFNNFDTAAVDASSSIVARSSASNDVVHDKIFIPTIASIGVLVIICIICCYQLIVSRDNVHLRGGVPVPRGEYNVLEKASTNLFIFCFLTSGRWI